MAQMSGNAMQNFERQMPPRVLLVEGPDDKHVVMHLCVRGGLQPNFEIIETGGKDPLLDSIAAEALARGRTVLGILLDADDDMQARWQAVTDRLRRVENLDLPDFPAQPGPNGTIIEGSPRIGIWLMPDNRSLGELEEFVAQMIPDGDSVWPLSEAYIESIPEVERKFAAGKIHRAKVHAWLATREDPRPMGLAIRAGDLDTTAENSTAFVNWLRKLFR